MNKSFKFIGDHPRLVANAYYTIPALHLITEINTSTLHSRLRYKKEFTERDVRPSGPPIIGPLAKRREEAENRLENKEMRESDKWLRIAL
tara:strand:+ start:455 stop:724 length:270 start_codon:yes stop_codon:yes gene_type:complete